ncbi:MAG TPA: metallophosphoesterase [Phenylobacterium sp.]|nr:metallophosphoesterase [Phenylobacterium sp.]
MIGAGAAPAPGTEHMRLAAAAILIALGLAGQAQAKAPLAMWVEITGAGAQVRAVAEGRACPTLKVDGKPRKMKLRAGPNEAFVHRICEASLRAGARRASVAGAPLPLPKARPQRLVILGDSGCRLKSPFVQDCNDPVAGWPFARVATLAAARKPDLVIHVGDYYYRETACPPGDAACAGSPYGDKWATWKAELFDPAAGLLKAAPWIFVRGNHEDCNRGGKGWFRLLDADANVRVCPAQSDTFVVDIGGLKLGVVDSADPDDVKLQPDQVEAFGKNLEPLRAAHGRVWLVTHRPPWEIGRNGDTLTDLNGNINERAAVKAGGLGEVELVLAGHIHNFTSLDFGPGRAPQLIVGTGGDAQDPHDLPPPAIGPLQVDGMTAQAFTMGRFGYFVFDRKGKGKDAVWEGAFHDLTDAVIATCALHAGRLTCAEAPGATEAAKDGAKE